VVWQDERNGEQDIYGAVVTPQGTILDTFAVITQQGDQLDPVLARDSGSRMLLAYSGWTTVVEEEPYNSPRIWAALSPVAGVEEAATAMPPAVLPATVVRGVLEVSTRDPAVDQVLFDRTGRMVISLRPGANDVSYLAPGVYFVREHAASGGHVSPRSPGRKVIVTE